MRVSMTPNAISGCEIDGGPWRPHGERKITDRDFYFTDANALTNCQQADRHSGEFIYFSAERILNLPSLLPPLDAKRKENGKCRPARTNDPSDDVTKGGNQFAARHSQDCSEPSKHPHFPFGPRGSIV
jgi:hypothetical protein